MRPIWAQGSAVRRQSILVDRCYARSVGLCVKEKPLALLVDSEPGLEFVPQVRAFFCPKSWPVLARFSSGRSLWCTSEVNPGSPGSKVLRKAAQTRGNIDAAWRFVAATSLCHATILVSSAFAPVLVAYFRHGHQERPHQDPAAHPARAACSARRRHCG